MSLFSPSIDEHAGPEAAHDDLAALRPAKLVLATDDHVGAALRRARESLGLDVEDIAQATHVRGLYIAALEAFDLDALPARPFAVGYVRAYARALGLDQETVVTRFKRETPGEDTKLRAPLGAQFGKGATSRNLVCAALVVVIGLVAWNLLVRMRSQAPRATLLASSAPIRSGFGTGPAILGAPLPAPPEATTPPPYETPGLAAATAATGPDTAAVVTARIAAEAAASRPTNAISAGAAFVAHGAVFGAPGAGSGIVLQAIRPMSLVVRGAGGAVYFARQLATGEAWRARDVAGLTADIDVPQSMEAYVDGRAVGPLSQPRTSLGSLNAGPSRR